VEGARDMTLVERFIEFKDWPASRKVVLLGCLSAPATLFAAILNVVIQRSDSLTPAVNLQLLNPFLVVWLIAQIALTALGYVAARAGKSAPWMAYLYAAANAPFVVAIIYLYGTMSTPFVAIMPMTAILWALYFDEKVAAFGLLPMIAAIVVIHFVESAGRLPFAPMLLDRSVDSQQNPLWFIAALSAVLMIFGFSFSICLLVLAARRLQESRLLQARQMIERSNHLLRRYMPKQLVERITSGSFVHESRPERRKLTIVFSELEGFTDASEDLDADQLAQVLNKYLSEMMTIADGNGATVNHLIGDSIMMFFGAPLATDDRDHAVRAVRMSLEMQQRMRNLQEDWLQHGLKRPLRVRIGLNTGYASVGDFGSEGRKIYSGVGVQTNLAARIQACCEPGKILISHPTWALVHRQFTCVSQGEVKMKGIHHPVSVYEVAEN
jgi:class 3 adenylate cyclase